MYVFVSSVCTDIYSILIYGRTLETGGGEGVFKFVTIANIGREGGLKIGKNCERNL